MFKKNLILYNTNLYLKYLMSFSIIFTCLNASIQVKVYFLNIDGT